jgi:hypothetical protein
MLKGHDQMNKRDRILEQYAADLLIAHTKQLKAIDKARKKRDTELAALIKPASVGKPKRSKADGSRSGSKRRPA